jgi:5-methylcytosine-specific restriction protein A
VFVRQGSYCAVHEAERKREADRRRPNAAQRGYDSKWQRYALSFLRVHPLCFGYPPGLHGDVPPFSQVVDHILPMEDGGGQYDRGNLQALCVRCHQMKTGDDTRKRNARRREAEQRL